MKESRVDLTAVIRALSLMTGGAFLLLPGACGAYYFADYMAYNFLDSLRFKIPISSIFNTTITVSLGSIFISIVVLGLKVRSIPSRWAPGFSLVLSILASVLAIIGFTSIFLLLNSSSYAPKFQTELLKLVLVFIGVLLVVVLPPFLHWRKQKNPRP